MNLLDQVKELEKAGIISEEKGLEIIEFLEKNNHSGSNRLFVVFGVIGASLIGLGLILIVAHNWDNLSKTLKTILAFIPLLTAQALAAFALFKKPESQAWRETTATFLCFSVACCLALISQIYNLQGELSSFILSWMILSLPIVYVLRSSFISLIYILGISFFLFETNLDFYNVATVFNFSWLWYLAIIPFYLWICKNRSKSNTSYFHHWIIPLSISLLLICFIREPDTLFLLIYAGLFGSFLQIGQLKYFEQFRLIKNGYFIIATFASIFAFFVFSFEEVWKEIPIKASFDMLSSNIPVFILLIIANGLATALLFYNFIRKRNTKGFSLFPASFLYLIFTVVYFIGMNNTFLATILSNITLFIIGVLIIMDGIMKDHLGVLNIGLLTMSILICCRFFDLEFGFVVKGIAFILLGISFFIVNFIMLRKRKNNES